MVRENIDEPPHKRAQCIKINEGRSNPLRRGIQELSPCDRGEGRRPMSDRAASSPQDNLSELQDNHLIYDPDVLSHGLDLSPRLQGVL